MEKTQKYQAAPRVAYMLHPPMSDEELSARIDEIVSAVTTAHDEPSNYEIMRDTIAAAAKLSTGETFMNYLYRAFPGKTKKVINFSSGQHLELAKLFCRYMGDVMRKDYRVNSPLTYDDFDETDSLALKLFFDEHYDGGSTNPGVVSRAARDWYDMTVINKEKDDKSMAVKIYYANIVAAFLWLRGYIHQVERACDECCKKGESKSSVTKIQMALAEFKRGEGNTMPGPLYVGRKLSQAIRSKGPATAMAMINQCLRQDAKPWFDLATMVLHELSESCELVLSKHPQEFMMPRSKAKRELSDKETDVLSSSRLRIDL